MTHKEIAAKLGISPAALSLIINHKPGVSEDTRERVLKELEQMNCGHLIKKEPAAPSKNLCFIIYKRHGEILDTHPFFLLLMENIETRAREYGFNILLCTIDKRKPMDEQIEYLKQLDSLGAILFATEMTDEDMTAFQTLTVPIVSLDNDFTRLTCNAISINNQMGTFQAIEHLLSCGFNRIGYLRSTVRISSFLERQDGFQHALAYYGKQFAPADILEVHFTEEGSYRDLKEYLESNKEERPAPAFVCDDDTIAAGAIRAFTEKGYHIPEDISIIGFNDRPCCEVTTPPLTSVNVSKHALAAEAVDELIRLIRNQKHITPETRSRKIRIGTKLVMRGSVSQHKK